MNPPPAKIFLETKRMYLREFQAGDAQLLFELDSDPEVMRFITKGHPTPLEKIQNEIIPIFLNFYRQSPPQGFWAAHLREGGEFVGWFHLRPGKLIGGEMELGYRLRRSIWGRGLATEGSIALLEKGFNEFGYAKISAHTMADNLKSRRVMEKAGLKREGELLYPADLFHDWLEENERRAVKYSITREDYVRQRQGC
jgi:RimJ/RimL family protein N-acetyltransferase